ncbi:MAG: GNAT family N-acetyltransferase [Anaerolineae bacterium]
MQASRLAATDGDVADQVRDNLIAYYRLFAGLPGITFVEEDVVWCVSQAEAPGNQVLRTQFAEESAERRIDDTIAEIARHADHIDWLVFPSCRPADLGQRLQARGMPGTPGGTWMLADLPLPSGPVAALAGFHVERVTDDALLRAWVQISSEGFQADVSVFYDAYARHGFGSEAISLHYVGYLGDKPVTSSTLLLAGGIAGIFDVSTPPALRRQGLGAAITSATVHEAWLRGYRRAWIWSSKMGKSVYDSLGFATVDLGIREYRWRR